MSHNEVSPFYLVKWFKSFFKGGKFLEFLDSNLSVAANFGRKKKSDLEVRETNSFLK